MPLPSFISCLAIMKPKERWDILDNAVCNEKLSAFKREILAKKGLSPDQKFCLLFASSNRGSFPLLWSCSYTVLFTIVSEQFLKASHATNIWSIPSVCSPFLREETWAVKCLFFHRDYFKLLLCMLICIYTTEDNVEEVALHLKQAGRQC